MSTRLSLWSDTLDCGVRYIPQSATHTHTTTHTMKKTLVICAVLVGAMGTAKGAVNDTTLVKYSKVSFETERNTNKAGKETTTYYAIVDGSHIFETTKTSVKRAETIQRFGGHPCLVLITNERNKKGRIATL